MEALAKDGSVAKPVELDGGRVTGRNRIGVAKDASVAAGAQGLSGVSW